MLTIRWNKKRVVIACGLFMFLYVLLTSGYNTYQIDAVIKNTSPEDVWNYVADFSKMKLLNPTILDFTITSDSGTPLHWQYSVLYKERLSHWPYWENLSTGDFSIRKEKSPKGDRYIVESKHKTCFLKGFYCLRSEGVFKFLQMGLDTYAVEKVFYQCPPLFGTFCKREVEFQRKAIMYNLTSQFKSKF